MEANDQIIEQDLYKEADIRRNKIETLQKDGVIVYAERFARTHKIVDALNLAEGTKVAVAGRMVTRRIFGKFMFIKLQDVEAKIQVSLSVNEIDLDRYKFFKDMVDIGDFVGVNGELYYTKTGELTVKAESYELLSKALFPLPEKFHGLSDTEARYRQRYLDLISNENTRKVLFGRIKLISLIRKYLTDNGFLEVETPILQSAVCGASAKPFMTKHNALNLEMNLRIAPETYLKQIIAGGFDRVFEVAKCFRNEGMDSSHLQEFTQVEWYASYWNFEDNIKFFTGFLRYLVKEMTGDTKLEKAGHVFDLSKDFPRVNYTETINKVLGFNVVEPNTVEELKERVVATGLFEKGEFNGLLSMGAVIDYIYKRKIRPNIIEPTILFNYPAVLVPLARRNDKTSKLIDMFQLLINGEEICKAYSELVDPLEQRRALEDQAKAKLLGDEEAMDLDEGFLLAVEHGMPPISGLGFGIDRFMIMLFDEPSIRDVIFFPIMKD
ncbi:MAG: lysine--tRNA ligase [Spirochaetales bacterium]